jgi:homoserine dehydrogenase
MDVRLALTGFGNVGKGVASLVHEEGERYQSEYGVRLLLTGVADQGGAAVDLEGLDGSNLLEAKNRHGSVAAAPGGVRGLGGAQFLDRAAAHVLLEAASTNFEDAEPGWTYVREALALKMDVVLASKGALVLHYGPLMNMARDRDARVLFSGTVGAPLPVLELADRVLVGARITGFEGILNSTANYILFQMADGATYEESVRRAQEIGIAETDPTLDVDGWDAAAKAAIVANAVMGANLNLRDIEREGIRHVTAEMLSHARREGQTLKLIARARRSAGGIRAEVRTERRPLADALGRLQGGEMGIVYHTEPLGSVSATVQRVGGIPTALTVLRDVVNLAKDRGWSSPSPG